MKRTFCLSFLGAAAAALLSLTAAAQAVPEAGPPTVTSYKYTVYGGFAYTSLNQVNLSRYGLMGGRVMVTRDFGKYFGVMGSGDYYKPPTGHGGTGNPGNPSVYSVLGGPELHANIYGSVDGLLFGELGMEHTGGEGMIPDNSFAGGFGGGLRYHLSPRWSLQVTGDRLAASFSLNNNTPQLSYSTHRSWNSRATVGAAFRF